MSESQQPAVVEAAYKIWALKHTTPEKIITIMRQFGLDRNETARERRIREIAERAIELLEEVEEPDAVWFNGAGQIEQLRVDLTEEVA